MDTYLQRFLHYIKFERGYATNTLTAYEKDLEQFRDFIQTSGIDEWRALVPDILEGFVVALQDRKYSASTVARKVATVRSFLNFLFAEGVIERELVDWLRGGGVIEDS